MASLDLTLTWDSVWILWAASQSLRTENPAGRSMPQRGKSFIFLPPFLPYYFSPSLPNPSLPLQFFLPTISFIFLPTLYYICWQGLSYLSPSASEPLSATQLCTGVSPIKSACSTWSFSIPSCISLATFGSSNESHFINTNNDSCSPVMMIINPKKRSKIQYLRTFWECGGPTEELFFQQGYESSLVRYSLTSHILPLFQDNSNLLFPQTKGHAYKTRNFLQQE